MFPWGGGGGGMVHGQVKFSHLCQASSSVSCDPKLWNRRCKRISSQSKMILWNLGSCKQETSARRMEANTLEPQQGQEQRNSLPTKADLPRVVPQLIFSLTFICKSSHMQHRCDLAAIWAGVQVVAEAT